MTTNDYHLKALCIHVGNLVAISKVHTALFDVRSRVFDAVVVVITVARICFGSGVSPHQFFIGNLRRTPLAYANVGEYTYQDGSNRTEKYGNVDTQL